MFSWRHPVAERSRGRMVFCSRGLSVCEHGPFGGLSGEVPFFAKYLKPYRAEVRAEYKLLKFTCNFLWRLLVVSFILNFLLGMLILL